MTTITIKNPPKYCFKVLGGQSGRRSKYGIGYWPKEGKWTPKIKDIELCARGWHLFEDFDDIFELFDEFEFGIGGLTIYVAEWRGDFLRSSDGRKIVVQQARLVEKLDGLYQTDSGWRKGRHFLFWKGKAVWAAYRKPTPGERRDATPGRK